MFGWFKKKPVVLINSDDTVLYDPTTVEVIDNRIDEKKDVGTCGKQETKCFDADEYLKKCSYARAGGIVRDVNFDDVCTPPPETIESLLNKFIEAGYDKPEVVITGETKVDGTEVWTASIDKQSVVWRKGEIYRYDCYCERSIGGIEKQVIEALKKLAKEQKRFETTITY